MATSVSLRKFPPNYDEHVYAGVLGLAIGANLGRRQGNAQRLVPTAELGRIGYDLNLRGDGLDRCNDERVAGALTAIRMLDDFADFPAVGTEHAAWTFLNYAIEGRTTLWWGGMGWSAPHSAFLRLKRGVLPNDCGSRAFNGCVVSEQGGGEMLGPCFGLVLPGDPPRAADLAGKCARVFYDGAGVSSAQASAAFVAAAFSSKTVSALFDAVLRVLPLQCPLSNLIADVHAWSSANSTWQHTRELIHEKYALLHGDGHAALHFAGVALALAHGGGSMREALEIAALSGWGDVPTMSLTACVLGTLHGLLEMESSPHWLGALNDRLLLPGADAGRCVSDAASEAVSLIRVALQMQRLPFIAPKKGARFHFEMPGSTHGFAVETGAESPGLAVVRNIQGHSRTGKRCLALEFETKTAEQPARVAVNVFAHESPSLTFSAADALKTRRAADVHGSPLIYPGQMLRAFVEAGESNSGETGVRPFIRFLGENDEPTLLRGPEKLLLPGACHEFKWTLPDGLHSSDTVETVRLTRGGSAPEQHRPILQGHPILDAGLEIFSVSETGVPAAISLNKAGHGLLYLDYFTWEGAPRVHFGPPLHHGSAWRRAWINAATRCEFGAGAHAYRVSQDEGIGLLIQGTRDWRDYGVMAPVTPLLARAAGVALRVQGLRRYYALLLFPDNKIRLIKQFYGSIILAEAEFNWRFGQTVELSLSIEGNRLLAFADGQIFFDVTDSQRMIDSGAAALVVEEGCMESGAVRVE